MNSSIDFDVWDALLKKYVDDRGRVDYVAWKREQPSVLPNWLSSVATLVFCNNVTVQGGASEQLALWINLYNAFDVLHDLR